MGNIWKCRDWMNNWFKCQRLIEQLYTHIMGTRRKKKVDKKKKGNNRASWFVLRTNLQKRCQKDKIFYARYAWDTNIQTDEELLAFWKFSIIFFLSTFTELIIIWIIWFMWYLICLFVLTLWSFLDLYQRPNSAIQVWC